MGSVTSAIVLPLSFIISISKPIQDLKFHDPASYDVLIQVTCPPSFLVLITPSSSSPFLFHPLPPPILPLPLFLNHPIWISTIFC
ncbi:hypothetical protein BDV28DRAFT_83677 [Aspergillus coremiiformis]|uniref:Uncharacterized protein n=1 Tax=Aspergillus coremiiformis TaxID=138285 RepID=A0A5N6Z9W2_9EURO|nr:hypothetical protein BDV28DRAFT_83677 [Aspergillus coremiiformis]